jgi:serine/threonine protein kinase
LGTRGYIAPELYGFSRSSQTTVPDPIIADMFALGQTVFDMLTRGELAFLDEQALAQYAQKKLKFPTGRLQTCSDAAKDFIKSAMHPSPDSRLPSSIAMGHSWIGGQATMPIPLPQPPPRRYVENK